MLGAGHRLGRIAAASLQAPDVHEFGEEQVSGPLTFEPWFGDCRVGL